MGVDFGGLSSLLRFDDLSLDPRTREIPQQLPLEQEQRTEMGQVQSTVWLALGLGPDAAPGPTALAVTALSLGPCHM